MKWWKQFQQRWIEKQVSKIVDELLDILRGKLLFEPNTPKIRGNAKGVGFGFLESKGCESTILNIKANKDDKGAIDIFVYFIYKGYPYSNNFLMGSRPDPTPRCPNW